VKKEVKILSLLAIVVVFATSFYVINVWHSRRKACLPYIEKMTKIFENDIDRTASRHRQLYKKFQDGALSPDEYADYLLVSRKYEEDVFPARTDIDSILFNMEMDDKCLDNKLRLKAELLNKKYSLLSNPESLDLQSLEDIDKKLSQLN